MISDKKKKGISKLLHYVQFTHTIRFKNLTRSKYCNAQSVWWQNDEGWIDKAPLVHFALANSQLEKKSLNYWRTVKFYQEQNKTIGDLPQEMVNTCIYLCTIITFTHLNM